MSSRYNSFIQFSFIHINTPRYLKLNPYRGKSPCGHGILKINLAGEFIALMVTVEWIFNSAFPLSLKKKNIENNRFWGSPRRRFVIDCPESQIWGDRGHILSNFPIFSGIFFTCAIVDSFQSKINKMKTHTLLITMGKKKKREDPAKRFFIELIDFFRKIHAERFFMWLIGFIYYLRFILQNNFKIVGLKNIPKNKNFLLVGNHSSVADAYLLMAGLVGRMRMPFWYVTKVDDSHKDALFSRLIRLSGGIPRRGTGEQIVDVMVKVLTDPKKRRVAIPPEGMYNKDGKVMRGFTGVIRVYHKANKKFKIPILPVVTIGAAEAYPTTPDPDGKFRPRKHKGIIGRVGKPFHLPPPKDGQMTREFLREQVDHVMDIIRRYALQEEPVDENWKLQQMQESFKGKKKRSYS
ncbi:MAG: lysophospholipid acyltransferase family protein [Candidatus Hodarchaeota archaeon]